MRSFVCKVAVAAAMATGCSVSFAVDLLPPIPAVWSGNVATVTFSNISFGGFQFSQITGLAGILTSVSVDATLGASQADTYASDLTLYVDPLPLSGGGLLQIGGYSSLGANERRTWSGGDSSLAGTRLVDTVTLLDRITLSGFAGDPIVYLGNGYGDPIAAGTWTGAMRMTFVQAVPEPQVWALLLAGIGVLGLLPPRRR